MEVTTKNGLEVVYYGMVPANLDELVDRLDDSDNRKVGRLARKEEDKNEFSYGIIYAVKIAIQKRNTANQGCSVSSVTAREDRLLRIRNSDGRATARKW